MICDICKCDDTLIKEYQHEYNIKGKKISFKSKRRFCKKCNNLVYDDKLDNLATQIAISKYNEQYGITSKEIVEFRHKLGLSQELFSKIIGCAKKTLVSYENNTSIPNDSYMIIIKSLLKEPETIKIIIEANKDHFTSNEYEKINSKISNNIKQLVMEDDYIPSEYNGYSKLSKEKINNIILFLSKDSIYKTKLLKEIFYIDFLFYKNTCKSITGLEYAKLPYGPVPDQFELLLSECEKEQLIDYKIEYNNQFECHNIIAKKKFDEKIFNEDELNVLNLVKNKFENYSATEIVEFSHREKAFIKSEYGNKISYDYAFDIESI